MYDVTQTMAKSVQLKQHESAICRICRQSFHGKQYLDMHVRCKHPSEFNTDTATKGERKLENVEEIDQPASVENSRNVQTRTADRTAMSAESEKIENRRGSDKRKSYSVEFKKQTLDLLDSLKDSKNKWQKVAEARRVSKSLVVKWNKARQQILSELQQNKHKSNAGGVRSARRRRQMVGNKARNSEMYPLAAKLVVAEFKLRRAKGSKVSKLWIKTKMKQKIEACYGEEAAKKFRGSDNWFQRFQKRHGICLRRRTNKKKDAAVQGKETIQMFHRDLRKAIQSKRRINKSTVVDRKYGRWLPQNRYNVDQVPLPFVVDQEKTYDLKGAAQVWVAQPASGLDKRQATLQLCIRAEGTQNVKPAIIFRGKGNITQQEKDQYDKDVDVFFQPNAWMDAELNMEWTKKTLKNGLALNGDGNEKVLFVDNVLFQQTKEFHVACRKLNTVVYMLPENHTDKIQPIDAGFGRMMKTKIGEARDKWLEDDENIEAWHDKLSAKKRRVLMTQWTGQAWREIHHTDPNFVQKLFVKTGCLMTSDGSEDDRIKPQGLEPYSF